MFDKQNLFYIVLPGTSDSLLLVHLFSGVRLPFHDAAFPAHLAQQAGARHNVAGFYLSFTAQADR